MSSMSAFDSTHDGDYNPEDVSYWAYVISRLPPLDNVFWNFVRAQQEMMTILEIQLNNGMYQGVTFQKMD